MLLHHEAPGRGANQDSLKMARFRPQAAILQDAAIFHWCKIINKLGKCEDYSMRTLVIDENQGDYSKNNSYFKQIARLFEK